MYGWAFSVTSDEEILPQSAVCSAAELEKSQGALKNQPVQPLC